MLKSIPVTPVKGISGLLSTSVLVVIATATYLGSTDAALAQQVTLPPPDPGSFSTTFDFLPDSRIVAFDGFEVSIQEALDSDSFIPIGTLPDAFQGGSDPAFVITDPSGSFFALSTGAGGSQFPDQPFNGSIFTLPLSGGTAQPAGNIPFNASAAFQDSGELFVNAGVDTFDSSSVQRLSVETGNIQTVIDNIPGASGGIAFDTAGNLFTGIGFDASGSRTGEIRSFSAASLEQSLLSGVPLDFDADGVFVTQSLSAGSLVFDEAGDLFVGGGDLLGGGEQGFIAEIDPTTGNVLRRLDPTDGDPDSGPTVFFGLAGNPAAETIGAIDFFDPTRTVFQISTEVPEPSVMLGSAVALSLGFLVKRREKDLG